MSLRNFFQRKRSEDGQTQAPDPDNDAEINEQLREIPELAAARHRSFYSYPMKDFYWPPAKRHINGELGFIKQAEADGIKRNYVYGLGCRGKGYYHLMTQDAWKILAKRCTESDVWWLLEQRAKSKFRNDLDPMKPAKPLKKPDRGGSSGGGYIGGAAGCCM